MARRSIGLAILAVLIVAVNDVAAMTLSSGDSNIVELLSQSSDVVVGKVDAVTDNCGGRGTYDSGAPSQFASRDAGLSASAAACP